MKKIIFVVLCVLLLSLFFFLKHKNEVHFDIEFEKLRPTKEKLNIYYNGYKVGHTLGISPCIGSKNSCFEAVLEDNEFFLPQNVYAKLKQKRLSLNRLEEYIELFYPNSPSYYSLQKKSKIKGELGLGLHNYVVEEISYSDMEQVKFALINSVVNLERATGVLVDLLDSLNGIVNSSKDEVKSTLKSVSETSRATENFAKKINTSTDEAQLRSVLENVDEISSNLNSSVCKIREITDEIYEYDVPYTLNSILTNADEIIGGMNCKLKKPFGGLRFLFGKPIR